MRRSKDFMTTEVRVIGLIVKSCGPCFLKDWHNLLEFKTWLHGRSLVTVTLPNHISQHGFVVEESRFYTDLSAWPHQGTWNNFW